MKIKDFAVRFLITFLVAFAATVLVTMLWNIFIDGKGPAIEWATSVRTALVFAIVIPLLLWRKN